MAGLSQNAFARPDVLSEEDAYRDLFARDPATAGQARAWGAEPTAATPGENAMALASVTPGIGNAVAAYDAYQGFGHLREASKAGDIREQRKAALGTLMSALGVMAPLPIGKMAGRVVEDAARTTNIFAGPTAKTANHVARMRALEMEGQGIARDEIWRATGWGRGSDGKWRFEIPDNQAQIAGLRPPESPNHAATFNDLSHPEYDAAYASYEPHEAPFRDYRPSEIYGLIDPRLPERGQQFPVSKSLFAQGPNPDSARSVTLHELQHHTQDLEDFARGGSPAMFSPEQVAAEQQRLMSAAPSAGQPSEASARFELYRRLKGEVEARNVQKRRNMTPEQRRNVSPWQTQDVPDDRQIDVPKRSPRNAFATDDAGPRMSFGGTESATAAPPGIGLKVVSEMPVDKGYVDGMERVFHITNGDNVVGQIHGGMISPDTFKIDWMQGVGDAKNTLGPAQIKQTISALREQYPGLRQIVGERGMGARKGTERAYETASVKLPGK